MPKNAILLLGPTGSGKTPLGSHIEKKGIAGRNCLHFDFGDQLRGVARSAAIPEGFTAADHSFIKDVLEKGLLLENEHFHIAEKIIALFIKKRLHSGEMLLLNGLPRHTDQARDVDRIVNIRGVVVLRCCAEDVYERIRLDTGSDRSGRVDDGLDMIRKKLEIFSARTAPLIDYYAASGRDIFTIKVAATSSTEDMYSEFSAVAANRLARYDY